jgi:hypothetical protein
MSSGVENISQNGQNLWQSALYKKWKEALYRMYSVKCQTQPFVHLNPHRNTVYFADYHADNV